MGTGTSKPKLVTFLIIVALMSSSLIAVEAVSIDSILKPSPPEFTVKIVSYPYDVPSKTTTTIDQYTGKQTTNTQPGYHVENKSIEIAIKNPQFTPANVTEYHPKIYYWYEGDIPSTVKGNYTTNLYYSVRVKGHFGNDWTTPQITYPSVFAGSVKAQLDSEYTVITCQAEYPNDAKIDFQVQALTGFYLAYGRSTVIFGYDFYGPESDWSNTHILTMGKVGSTAVPDKNQPTPTPTTQPTPTQTPEETATPTQTPTQTPSQPVTQTGVLFGLDWEKTVLIVLAVAVAALTVGMFALWRRKAAK